MPITLDYYNSEKLRLQLLGTEHLEERHLEKLKRLALQAED